MSQARSFSSDVNLVMPGFYTDSSKIFRAWKTAKHTCRNIVEVRFLLIQGQCRMDKWTDDVLSQRANFISKDKSVVDPEFPLVKVSGYNLGFKVPAKHRAIVERAEVLGLNRCELEDSPYVRLAYADQPRGELALIAMDSVAAALYGNEPPPVYPGPRFRDVDLDFCYLHREITGEVFLHMYYGTQDDEFDPSVQWVFRQ